MRYILLIFALLITLSACDSGSTITEPQDTDPDPPPTQDEPPPPPENLEAVGGFYKVDLAWDTVGTARRYKIYRNNEYIAASDTGGYTDTEVADGETYYYDVVTVGSDGQTSKPSEQVSATPTFEGDVARGKELFRAECSACHANIDGWDFKAFAFPDTMIHRRALDHVDFQEGLDIVSFIQSQDIPSRPNTSMGVSEMPPFQPGDRILDSDHEFAIELFGQDQWPEHITPEDLTEYDPTQVSLPFALPRWSVEEDESDWLPEKPLPDRILVSGEVERQMEVYQQNRSDENLIRLWRAIRANDEKADRFPPDIESRYIEALEVKRWVSTLMATHAMRSGDEIAKMKELVSMTVDGKPTKDLHHSPISEMWAVGDIFRSGNSHIFSEPYVNDIREPAALASKWFYVSWQFSQMQSDFSLRYFTNVLSNFGYERVGAYILGYTIVSGQFGHQKAYSVMEGFDHRIPEHWQPNLLHFAMNGYLWRIENGDYVRGNHDLIIERLNTAVQKSFEASDDYTENDKQVITEKKDRIVEWIKEQKEEWGNN